MLSWLFAGHDEKKRCLLLPPRSPLANSPSKLMRLRRLGVERLIKTIAQIVYNWQVHSDRICLY